MTFEKNNADPIQDRVHEQYVALWTSLDALAGRKRLGAQGLGSVLPTGLQRGRTGQARAQCRLRARQRARAGGAEREDPQLLHPALEGEGRRGAEPRSVGCSGWMSRCGSLTKPLRVPDYREYGAKRDTATRLPARDVLHPDGAGAEALGPGDARRGQLRAVPVLLRRDGVERSVAQQHRRRPFRRRTASALQAGEAQAAAKSPGQGQQQAQRRRLAARPRQHLGLRVRGLDALPVRGQVEAARTPASPATRSAAVRSTTSTSGDARRRLRRGVRAARGESVVRLCSSGCPTGAGWCRWQAAPYLRRCSG